MVVAVAMDGKRCLMGRESSRRQETMNCRQKGNKAEKGRAFWTNKRMPVMGGTYGSHAQFLGEEPVDVVGNGNGNGPHAARAVEGRDPPALPQARERGRKRGKARQCGWGPDPCRGRWMEAHGAAACWLGCPGFLGASRGGRAGAVRQARVPAPDVPRQDWKPALHRD